MRWMRDITPWRLGSPRFGTYVSDDGVYRLALDRRWLGLTEGAGRVWKAYHGRDVLGEFDLDQTAEAYAAMEAHRASRRADATPEVRNVMLAMAEVYDEGARASRCWSMNMDRQQDAEVYEKMANKAREIAGRSEA